MSDTTGRGVPDPSGGGDPRSRLLTLRELTAAQLAGTTHDLGDVVDAAALVATDDEHDPEGATIAYERAQLSAVAEQLVHHLAEIDHALARLDEGGYGRCELCGTAIPAERLEARPSAVTCVGCASPSR